MVCLESCWVLLTFSYEENFQTTLFFWGIPYVMVGHLQDDDEADTVGCCTLKVGNVECIPPNKLKVRLEYAPRKDSISLEWAYFFWEFSC